MNSTTRASASRPPRWAVTVPGVAAGAVLLMLAAVELWRLWGEYRSTQVGLFSRGGDQGPESWPVELLDVVGILAYGSWAVAFVAWLVVVVVYLALRQARVTWVDLLGGLVLFGALPLAAIVAMPLTNPNSFAENSRDPHLFNGAFILWLVVFASGLLGSIFVLGRLRTTRGETAANGRR